MSSALEKILRLTAPPAESEPDRIRSLSQAVSLALTTACETADPLEAARMTFAARELSAELSGLFYTEAMEQGPAKARVAAALPKPAETAKLSGSQDMSVMTYLASGEGTVFLAAAPPGDIPMHHAPFTGTHEHAHHVSMVHGHGHSHQGDNAHGGPVHGDNSGQKAWAAKGQTRRMDY